MRLNGRQPRGFALIVALLATVVLSALAVGLALGTSTETRIAANFANADQAAYAAESAVERAKHLLKLGFIVHDISGPDGVYLDEKAALQQLGPATARARTPAPSDVS